MFENKKAGRYEAHYSRYIASWYNVGGGYYFGDAFREWLAFEGLNEKEISDVVEMATCGKLELEYTAQAYVNKQKKDDLEYLEEKGDDENDWFVRGIKRIFGRA